MALMRDSKSKEAAMTKPTHASLEMVGVRLKERRESLNLSQDSVARALGTNQATWARMELGAKKTLDAILIASFCKRYGQSWAYIMYGEGEPQTRPRNASGSPNKVQQTAAA